MVEENNYAAKIVKANFFGNLDNWPKIPLNNFNLKSLHSCLANITKYSEERKYLYSGYGIAFDELGS